MAKIEIGIKLWTTNINLYPRAVELYRQGKIDYLELKYVLDKSEQLEILKEGEIPIILHAPNTIDGVDFGDDNFEKNLKVITEMERIADQLNVTRIIIHPEFGSIENVLTFLKKAHSKRLIIENVPKMTILGPSLGFSPEILHRFLALGYPFCLDFAHAIKSAVAEQVDYKNYLKQFLELNPEMFHFNDGNFETDRDEHLHLGEGNFDLAFLKSIVTQHPHPKVTLETPRHNLNSFEEDLKNIEYFKNI